MEQWKELGICWQFPTKIRGSKCLRWFFCWALKNCQTVANELCRLIKMATPRKTNMSPENQWLEDLFPIEIVPFEVTSLHFQGRMCSDWNPKMDSGIIWAVFRIEVPPKTRWTGTIFSYGIIPKKKNMAVGSKFRGSTWNTVRKWAFQKKPIIKLLVRGNKTASKNDHTTWNFLWHNKKHMVKMYSHPFCDSSVHPPNSWRLQKYDQFCPKRMCGTRLVSHSQYKYPGWAQMIFFKQPTPKKNGFLDEENVRKPACFALPQPIPRYRGQQ